MMMSWFTRNAADHERGTSPIRRPSPCTRGCVNGAREMNLSVVATKLSTRSMNLGSSEGDR